jgi:hypothetical protein
MMRGLVLVAVTVMMLTVCRASGQIFYPPIMDPPTDRGHIDRPGVPIEQMADVIVVLVPDETLDLRVPTSHERVVRGTIVELHKGPLPQMIVHTPNGIVSALQAGVPAKLFLKKIKDRDAYDIIGNFAASPGAKP